jgi:hypothetical protein
MQLLDAVVCEHRTFLRDAMGKLITIRFPDVGMESTPHLIDEVKLSEKTATTIVLVILLDMHHKYQEPVKPSRLGTIVQLSRLHKKNGYDGSENSPSHAESTHTHTHAIRVTLQP